MARPQFKIDKGLFERMCEVFCTKREISHVLGCSEDTIERFCKKEYKMTFTEVLESKSSVSKYSLRQYMMAHARKNYKAAIWMSEHYLELPPVKANVDETTLQALNRLDNILMSVRENAGDTAEPETE